MPEMLNDLRRKFLEYFEPAKRSTVANTFLTPIRKGMTDPDLIITEVYEKARRDKEKHYISDTIFSYLSEAFKYVSYLQDWEHLPDSEKQYYKNIQAKKAVKAYMAKEKPTDKQLSYLKALGYTGPAPESKADASELISTIKVFNKI
jgi:nitroreductase